jgi:DNA polymerase (family X)
MSKGERVSIGQALKVATQISDALSTYQVQHEICGSIRRGSLKDVGDVDIAVRDIQKAVYVLERTLEIKFIFPAKSKYTIPKNVHTEIGNLKVELYQADARNWGAMLLHLTGSGLFNIKMRVFAKAHGFKLNQYGLWGYDATNHWENLAAKTEKAIFKRLGLRYVPPEHREFEETSSIWNYKIRR